MHRKRETICKECSQVTTEPRRGLCQRCYLAQYRGQEKAKECQCCGWADPRALVRRRDVNNEWMTLCGNCAVILGRRKLSLDALREDIFPEGDRRSGYRRTGQIRRRTPDQRNDDDQRLEERDTPDRRGSDRRSTS